eukprot:UN25609
MSGLNRFEKRHNLFNKYLNLSLSVLFRDRSSRKIITERCFVAMTTKSSLPQYSWNVARFTLFQSIAPCFFYAIATKSPIRYFSHFFTGFTLHQLILVREEFVPHHQILLNQKRYAHAHNMQSRRVDLEL